MLCHRKLAAAISAVTVCHELAQEGANFFLLTKHCNVKVPLALALNFVSGLSVLLGATIMLSFDVAANATGCILAIGSGVYIYIAAAECSPRARKAQTATGDKIISVVSFIFGVTPGDTNWFGAFEPRGVRGTLNCLLRPQNKVLQCHFINCKTSYTD
jgi:uncharacterized membrane protein YfcA